MDRKARDLESGKKRLEEYKRKKQAKGAALRQQLTAGSDPATPSTGRSDASDAPRSKYQERLEARLAAVLGNTTNRGARDDDPDVDTARLDQRREKALDAGQKLSDELAAARADIAAARDLAAGVPPSPSPSEHIAFASPRLRQNPSSADVDASPTTPHAPAAPASAAEGLDRADALRERLRREHAELARLRGELAATRVEATAREEENERLRAAERRRATRWKRLARSQRRGNRRAPPRRLMRRRRRLMRRRRTLMRRRG